MGHYVALDTVGGFAVGDVIADGDAPVGTLASWLTSGAIAVIPPRTPDDAIDATAKAIVERHQRRAPKVVTEDDGPDADIDLDALTVKELRKLAKAFGLAGYSRAYRRDLIEMLREWV